MINPTLQQKLLDNGYTGEMTFDGFGDFLEKYYVNEYFDKLSLSESDIDKIAETVIIILARIK